MNCPYCDARMERGALKTEGGPGLFDLPGNEKYGAFRTGESVVQKGGVCLDGPYLTRFHDIDVPCWACKACKKIIIAYDEV